MILETAIEIIESKCKEKHRSALDGCCCSGKEEAVLEWVLEVLRSIGEKTK